MLKFRVFGLPRSGTTWVANWLTTAGALCLHDPCEMWGASELEQWAKKQDRDIGVSDTWLWMDPTWERDDYPTILMVRDPAAIQASLDRRWLPRLSGHVLTAFDRLTWPRFELRDLFDPMVAMTVQATLLPGTTFDRRRHAELVKMNVQPSAAECERARKVLDSIRGV
jgi:hypothetical protein